MPPIDQSAAARSANSHVIATKLDLAEQSGALKNLHAVLVWRKGQLLAERYYSGPDESWGRDLGTVAFGPGTLHDLRSVTKSVVGLLYGIALAEGKVPALDTPLLDAFPEHKDLAKDPQRAAWTIGHVLSMAMGTTWNEDLPYTDPRNSEIAMERAEDRVRFILEQPLEADPGTRWDYNGGCSALIGALISSATGGDLLAYARDVLFDPLAIPSSEWIQGQDKAYSAASGLRLSGPSLLRIGQLVLQGGQWDGRQIVPSAWIEASKAAEIHTSWGMGYSRFWYGSEQSSTGADGRVTGSHFTLGAMGNGGQRLWILPDLDLVVVTYSGLYNAPDQWINPTLILQRIILANLD